MIHLAVNTLQRYIKIYLLLVRFGFVLSTMYHISFFIELFVELGYQIVLIFLFVIVYHNVKTVAGWSFNEILILQGINIFASEVLVGSVFLSTREIPKKIKNGDIDVLLLKPIHGLFYLAAGYQYFTSYLVSNIGIFVILYTLYTSHMFIPLVSILPALFIFLCGYSICWSIVVICALFSFVFTNATYLPIIGESLIFDYKQNPHQVYNGIFKIIFFLIIPIVFIASIPASTLLHGLQWTYLLLGFLLSCMFLTVTILMWNRVIKNYTSASS